MRLLLQPIGKIGRIGFAFKLNTLRNKLTAKHRGVSLVITADKPWKVMIEDEDKVFAWLGDSQFDRVKRYLDVE